jgi:hypothetical protein
MNRFLNKLMEHPDLVRNMRVVIFVSSAVVALMASAIGVAAGPDLGGP